ncbi:expressed protein [Phakopsora pachyrhizi]|uniref:Expressed protein n=1 Tax=Phakopsora pachyrhizi TaxID=170000 RepID=A0AAV0B729_PHAPC|nr:expressed protein [Phakopsora pachyrhizi]
MSLTPKMNQTAASTAVNAKKLEAIAATISAVKITLYTQVGAVVLAFLLAAPLIFRSFSQGRYKTGWILKRNKMATGGYDSSVNRAPNIPIGRSSSPVGIFLSKINNLILLKIVPLIVQTSKDQDGWLLCLCLCYFFWQ